MLTAETIKNTVEAAESTRKQLIEALRQTLKDWAVITKGSKVSCLRFPLNSSIDIYLVPGKSEIYTAKGAVDPDSDPDKLTKLDYENIGFDKLVSLAKGLNKAFADFREQMQRLTTEAQKLLK